MARVSLIINLAGPDQPGLVEKLSTAISSAGANWERSRLARLSGHFAGVVHVVAPTEKVGEVKAGLDALSDDLLVSVVEVDGEHQAPVSGETIALEVVGQDRTGIVKEISQALAALGVNVDELITECYSAPMSGERIFEVTAAISLPPGVGEDEVQKGIEEIAEDLTVSFSELEEAD